MNEIISGPMFDGSILSEKRAEKKNSLYEKADKKINIILNLEKLAKEISNLGMVELSEKCRAEIGLIENEFKEASQSAKEQFKIEERIEKLEDILYPPGKLMSEEDAESVDQNAFDELWHLRDKASEMDSNEDILFLTKTYRFFKNIQEKRRQVIDLETRYNQNENSFFDYLLKQEVVPFVNQAEARFHGVSVNIILPEFSFQIADDFDGKAGFHIHGTVFNVIKKDSILKQEEVINHEENHNLSESFTSLSSYWESFIKRTIRDINAIEEDTDRNIPEPMRIDRLSSLKRRMEKYAFSNFGEIIADIDEIAGGKINTFLSNFLDAIEKAEEVIDQVKNENLRDTLISFFPSMRNAFVEQISGLSRIFFAAAKSGITDRARGAIILFGSLSKAERQLENASVDFCIYRDLQPLITDRHYFAWIDKFIRKRLRQKEQRSPEEKLIRNIFDPLEKNLPGPQPIKLLDDLHRDISPRNFFKFKNIKELGKILKTKKNGEVSLSAEERKNLEKNLNSFEPDDFRDIIETQIRNRHDFLDFDRNIKVIFDYFNVGEINDVRGSLIYFFMEEECKKAVETDDFSSMETIYNKLRLNEQADIFLSDLLEYEFIFDDYEEILGKKYNSETIKTSNFWKFLEKINFHEKADVVLKKLKNKN